MRGFLVRVDDSSNILDSTPFRLVNMFQRFKYPYCVRVCLVGLPDPECRGNTALHNVEVILLSIMSVII